MAGVKLGVGIPQSFPNRAIDPDYIRRYLVRAEALGFEVSGLRSKFWAGCPRWSRWR